MKLVYSEIYCNHSIEIYEEGKKRYCPVINGERYYKRHDSIKISLYAIHRIIDNEIKKGA